MVMRYESIRGELRLPALQERGPNCFGIPEKGAEWAIKVGMFLLVALISVYPTMRFLAWRKMLKQGDLPALTLPTITRLRAVIRLELGLLIVIPLLAVLMARGIGRTL